MSKTILKIGIMAILIAGLTGCGKSIKCTNHDSKVDIDVIEFYSNPAIIKDRGNLFGETIYGKNLSIDGNMVTAEKSGLSNILWGGMIAPNSIKLNAEDDTVEVGENKYQCETKLITLIDFMKAIENKHR